MASWLEHLKPTGLQQNAAIAEKWVATLGGCLAVFCISATSVYVTGAQGAAAVVPSMGAATVLLFAVPHGPLSQPWALFVGNALSAAVGVSCALIINNILVAAALAVGIAIGLMHLTRSIHPPGGATALAAVIGGEAVRDLGYWYVFAPTLLNCCIIFVFAVIFNGLFPWRRYPLAIVKYSAIESDTIIDIAPDSLQRALKTHHIDIPVEQLIPAIHEAIHASPQNTSHLPITLGGVYCNEKPGAEWAVRKIIDEHPHPDPEKDLVIYMVLEGNGSRRSESCRRYEFAIWARKQLRVNNESLPTNH